MLEDAREEMPSGVVSREAQLARRIMDRAEASRVEAAMRRRQAAITILRRDALEDSLAAMRQDGATFLDGMTALLVGSHQRFAGSRKSASARFAGIMKEYSGGVARDLDRIEGAAELLRGDRAFGEQVLREMLQPGATGDGTARQVADVFSSWLERNRQRLNEAGANIGRLDGYAPQSHDAAKLLAAGETAWIEHMLPRLDWERSLGGELGNDWRQGAPEYNVPKRKGESDEHFAVRVEDAKTRHALAVKKWEERKPKYELPKRRAWESDDAFDARVERAKVRHSESLTAWNDRKPEYKEPARRGESDEDYTSRVAVEEGEHKRAIVKWEENRDYVLGMQRRTALAEIWTTIVTGRDRKLTLREQGIMFRRPGSIARGMEKERVLHFRDADAAIEYHREYGRGHIGDAVLGQLSAGARKLALMETFGPNPEAMIGSLLEAEIRRLREAPAEAIRQAVGGDTARKLERVEAEYADAAGRGDDAAAARARATLESTLAGVRGAEISKIQKAWTGDGHGRLANYYKALSGESSSPVNVNMARMAAGARGVISMAKLGGAVLSAFADVFVKAANLRHNGENLLSAWRLAFDMRLERLASPEQKELGRALGVYSEGFLRDLHDRFGMLEGDPGGGMSRWMNTFFRYSGLDAWTEGHKAAYTHYLSNRLAEHAETPFRELDEHMAASLRRHGLEDRWDLMRRLVQVGPDGRHYVVPERAFDLGDADVEHLLRESYSDSGRPHYVEPSLRTESDGEFLARVESAKKRYGEATKKWEGREPKYEEPIRRDDESDERFATRVERAKERHTKSTVEWKGKQPKYVEPERLNKEKAEDFAIRVEKAKAKHADAVATWEAGRARELDRLRRDLVTDVMGYYADETRYAVLEPDEKTRALMYQGTRPGTVVGEVLRSVLQFKSFSAVYGQRFLREMRWQQAGHEQRILADMPGMVHAVAGSVLMGYVAMTAKDLAKGRQPRDPMKPETWMAAAVQSGGLGIFGDYFLGVKNRFGSEAASALLGPLPTLASQVLPISGQLVRGEFEGAGEDALRLGINNTPFINLWYTRGALDYLLLFHIREALSPGTLARSERKLREEYNQTYLQLGPVDLTPSKVVRRGGGFR
ncbi:hypothetical protein [Nitratidesulfovibrio termitidis]|uniref:hypothetical protein n=1 Tax=Nitratidesulfovibrio termitidis TaxID=42252 RepID=UPI0012EB72FF|nr:hypothetical protein [Nitratidesulfovibrio termitidis]